MDIDSERGKSGNASGTVAYLLWFAGAREFHQSGWHLYAGIVSAWFESSKVWLNWLFTRHDAGRTVAHQWVVIAQVLPSLPHAVSGGRDLRGVTMDKQTTTVLTRAEVEDFLYQKAALLEITYLESHHASRPVSTYSRIVSAQSLDLMMTMTCWE